MMAELSGLHKQKKIYFEQIIIASQGEIAPEAQRTAPLSVMLLDKKEQFSFLGKLL